MRPVLEVKPGQRVGVLGTIIINDNLHKPMYVRVGKKSVTVSDRIPAAYGARRAK